MNKLLKYNCIVFCLAVSLVLTSCSKKLDIRPTDQVDGSVALSNLTNVNLAVLGIYATWKNEYVDRIGSVLADECRIGWKNSGIGLTDAAQNLFRWAYTSGDQEVLDVWSNSYQVIFQINDILAAIDNVPTTNSSDVQQKQNLKGELLGLRAFLHFELFRTYGYSGVYSTSALAVPYITGTNIYAKPSRPSTNDFFQSLNTDLAGADSLLTTNSAINRFGLTALQALHARIALYTEDWNTAIQMSTRVINAVPLASAANFPDIWTDQNTSEVIFELSRTNQSTVRPGDMWYNIEYGVYLFAPSKALMNLYDTTNDIRYHSYFTIDSTLIAQGQMPDMIAKYQGTAGAQNLNNLKIFRTGEMYLIRAEAYANTGDLADANADLNTLRAQRISGYSNVTYNNFPDLQTAIATERYKELCFEGHRYFDIKRRGQNIVRQTIDLPSGSTNTTLTPSSMYYYVPIPQPEVLSNPNILPNNKGW